MRYVIRLAKINPNINGKYYEMSSYNRAIDKIEDMNIYTPGIDVETARSGCKVIGKVVYFDLNNRTAEIEIIAAKYASQDIIDKSCLGLDLLVSDNNFYTDIDGKRYKLNIISKVDKLVLIPDELHDPNNGIYPDDGNVLKYPLMLPDGSLNW